MAIRVFADLWKSKVSRFLLLLLIFIVVFSTIYIHRINIYIRISSLGQGIMYDDPSTYNEGPYGFTEDAEKAEEVYRDGLKELLEYTEDTYNFSIVEPIFDSAISENEHWAVNLSNENAKIIKVYLNDVRLFCRKFKIPKSITAEIDYNERLRQRHKKFNDDNAEISDYAIGIDSFVDHANQLMAIDQNYLEIALQKKPDYLPALNLRNEIKSSACKELSISMNIMRTLSYIEYKTNKIEYFKAKKLHSPDPEIASDNAFHSLKSNRTYRSLIKKHFSHSYYLSGNDIWKTKKSWSLYIFSHDKDYLNKFIASTLNLSRVSSVAENKKYYKNLLDIRHRGIEFNFLYNYALAEVAFRAKSIVRSKFHLKQIFENKSFNQHPDIIWAKRLLFALDVID